MPDSLRGDAESEPVARARLADDAGSALARIGIAKFNAHEHAEAEQLLRRALEIFERSAHADWSETVQTLNALAALLIAQGRLDDAEPLLRRALSITEHQLGLEHPDVAYFLNNLAQVYLKRRQFYLAERLLLRLLAIRRKDGEESPGVASALANLALAREGAGELVTAQELWSRVLAIREQTLPPDSPAIALTLEHLADSYAAAGRVADAVQLRERALGIRERTLGGDHASLAVARARLMSLRLEESGTLPARDAPREQNGRLGGRPGASGPETTDADRQHADEPRSSLPEAQASPAPPAAPASGTTRSPNGSAPVAALGDDVGRSGGPAHASEKPAPDRTRGPRRPLPPGLLRALVAAPNRRGTRPGIAFFGRARRLLGRSRDTSSLIGPDVAPADEAAETVQDREVPRVPVREQTVTRGSAAPPPREGNAGGPTLLRSRLDDVSDAALAQDREWNAGDSIEATRGFDLFSESAWPKTRLACTIGVAASLSLVAIAAVSREGGLAPRAYHEKTRISPVAHIAPTPPPPAPRPTSAVARTDPFSVAAGKARPGRPTRAPAATPRPPLVAASSDDGRVVADRRGPTAGGRLTSVTGSPKSTTKRTEPRTASASPAAVPPSRPVSQILEDATRAIDSASNARAGRRVGTRQSLLRRLWPF